MLTAVLLSGATAAAITAVLVTTRRRWPGALAAWIAYLILLGPMSGIVPFGRLRGAVDRYTYTACLGWALVAGGAAVIGWRAWTHRQASRFLGALTAGVLVAVLLGWSVLSWRQAAVWRDGVTLWTRAVEVVPDSAPARVNLGTALVARRDFAAAETHFHVAARAWPLQVGAFQNLGRALAAQGKWDEAEPAFRRVVALQPRLVEGQLDLGTTLYRLGRLEDAAQAFEQALLLDPRSVRGHRALATLRASQGRREEAERHLRRAVELEEAARPAMRPVGGSS